MKVETQIRVGVGSGVVGVPSNTRTPGGRRLVDEIREMQSVGDAAKRTKLLGDITPRMKEAALAGRKSIHISSTDEFTHDTLAAEGFRVRICPDADPGDPRSQGSYLEVSW